MKAEVLDVQKTCPTAALYTPNLKKNGPASDPHLRREWPATIRLNLVRFFED